MKPNDKVSIIIVNKDRKENMQNCLNSVIKQDYPLKEIIVVDNNSADSSCQMIKTEFPKVILIENKKLREKMGKNSFKLVDTGKFSIKKRNKKLRRIYDEALKD